LTLLNQPFGGAGSLVDSDRSVPLYYQVYTAIRQAIEQGQLREGDVLPTEQALCEVFGVSRVTVRQAVANLIRDGYVVRLKPRGRLTVRTRPIVQRLSLLAPSAWSRFCKVTRPALWSARPGA
jgi:DNA-binding GntR family transcriptional regulator